MSRQFAKQYGDKILNFAIGAGIPAGTALSGAAGGCTGVCGSCGGTCLGGAALALYLGERVLNKRRRIKGLTAKAADAAQP